MQGEFKIFDCKVSAVVNLDGGKIVTVQKAKKDGEKSTKVTWVMMMIMMMDCICAPPKQERFPETQDISRGQIYLHSTGLDQEIHPCGH